MFIIIPLEAHPQYPQLHGHAVQRRHGGGAIQPAGLERWPWAGVGPGRHVGLAVVLEALAGRLTAAARQPAQVVLAGDHDVARRSAARPEVRRQRILDDPLCLLGLGQRLDASSIQASGGQFLTLTSGQAGPAVDPDRRRWADIDPDWRRRADVDPDRQPAARSTRAGGGPATSDCRLPFGPASPAAAHACHHHSGCGHRQAAKRWGRGPLLEPHLYLAVAHRSRRRIHKRDPAKYSRYAGGQLDFNTPIGYRYLNDIMSSFLLYGETNEI